MYLPQYHAILPYRTMFCKDIVLTVHLVYSTFYLTKSSLSMCLLCAVHKRNITSFDR